MLDRLVIYAVENKKTLPRSYSKLGQCPTFNFIKDLGRNADEDAKCNLEGGG
jgi:hypothetical protein